MFRTNIALRRASLLEVFFVCVCGLCLYTTANSKLQIDMFDQHANVCALIKHAPQSIKIRDFCMIVIFIKSFSSQ